MNIIALFSFVNKYYLTLQFSLEIAPSSVSANITDTLNNSGVDGVDNITPFYRWSSEKMDKYIEWALTHEDIDFNVFSWMCEKGIIEKASYTDSYIN